MGGNRGTHEERAQGDTMTLAPKGDTAAICGFCYGHSVVQVTGHGGELVSVPCPVCGSEEIELVKVCSRYDSPDSILGDTGGHP